jgi:hypothetical protein
MMYASPFFEPYVGKGIEPQIKLPSQALKPILSFWVVFRLRFEDKFVFTSVDGEVVGAAKLLFDCVGFF